MGGGNTQTFSGSFTRTSGQTGVSGTAELAGSLLLANNNFYRQFTDDPAITAGAQALPQMTGSGAVRDLRAAMSLGTAQSADLLAKLTQFAADTKQTQQKADLDALIQSWGATSAMPTSILTNRQTDENNATTLIEQFAQSNPGMYAKITALEQFNGTTILDKWVRTTSGQTWATDHWQYWTSYSISHSGEQGTFIDQAYDALKSSVYGALVVQTRLKPYLDRIGESIATKLVADCAHSTRIRERFNVAIHKRRGIWTPTLAAKRNPPACLRQV